MQGMVDSERRQKEEERRQKEEAFQKLEEAVESLMASGRTREDARRILGLD
jgi:DNA-binding transcriptional regulator YhcF (GntR family)